MDRDEKRRGQASIHKLYQEKALAQGMREPSQFGIGAAICLGDMAIFIGYDLINRAELSAEKKQLLLQVTNQELIQLGMSQLQDAYLAARPQTGTEEDILSMYRGKTGRYTWRWPLLLAAATTDQSSKFTAQLEAIAQVAGLLFQLKDDEIGLFGDEQHVGKQVGSDVREGKKTLYWLYLQELQADTAVKQALSYFGLAQVDLEQLNIIRHLVLEKGIKQRVDAKMEKLYLEAQAQIAQVEGSAAAQAVLNQLLDLTYQRQK
jgi:geranylgeranyl diphosphate synthase type I